PTTPPDSPARGRPHRAGRLCHAAADCRRRCLAPDVHARPGTRPTTGEYRPARSDRAGAVPPRLAVGPGRGAVRRDRERAVTGRASYTTDSGRTGPGRVPGHALPADTTPALGRKSVLPQGLPHLWWRAALPGYIAMSVRAGHGQGSSAACPRVLMLA